MSRKSMILFLALLAVCFASISHAADAGTFNVQVLLPGVTKSIEIRQQQVLPLGCPQFFIFTIGSGMLGLSVVKNDVAGDTIFMAGFVSNGGRIVPVRRIGTSTGMVDQVIEIKGDDNTISFCWILCGVAASQNVPIYSSVLRLSLQP
jgi:hypothetical protein